MSLGDLSNCGAVRAAGRGLTVEELLALPVAVDLVTAGKAFLLGRTKSHELARAGKFPCPVLRIGNAYRVTRADLLRSLGIDPQTNGAGPATGPATANVHLEDITDDETTCRPPRPHTIRPTR